MAKLSQKSVGHPCGCSRALVAPSLPGLTAQAWSITPCQIRCGSCEWIDDGRMLPVVEFSVVLPNGTSAVIDEESYPLLMK
eukprot:scaffold235896_cov31-Prasinocladus_malaysianus.AAC.1